MYVCVCMYVRMYVQGADKSLARPRRKQATATEGFDFPIYYHNWKNINIIYVYNKTSIK